MDQAQRAVIALLLCFAIWCGWQSKLSSQPTQLLESGETTKKTNKNSANNNPFELFWNWTTRDAVSFYTFVLAIFTGVLGGTAIIQIHFLRRADETAHVTADATTTNALAA
jgi:ABC-type nitrate/sulfonate/bicarbonate transport system permease component